MITIVKKYKKGKWLFKTSKPIDISCKLNRSNEDITLNNDNENFLITTSNTSISSLKSLEKSAKKKKMNKRSRNQSLSNETESKLNKNNFSRSIDSIDSLNRPKLKNELAKLTTKSVDFAKLNEKKNSNFIFVNSILPQRSIDYPCIVRKAPKLSDIVRKRLLFQKVSRGATLLGESFSNSIEKDHVPKAPRKIIIRQDNSIEISLSRPPKLRRQNFSEDITTSNFAHQSASLVEPSGLKQNPSMLSVSSTNDRRKTIETCENIFIQSEESTKLRARTPPSNPHRILLYKDKSDKSIRKLSGFFDKMKIISFKMSYNLDIFLCISKFVKHYSTVLLLGVQNELNYKAYVIKN
ncbi:hypothetical protein BpHYR1_025089 [Brachionus plicatilis]|uniref:Uncharacterized protein n=1 Tax=Brachionus plicatilis TaxID=10195 RepID=A0A3M7RGE0_BRAPC|nr:hypothetical protein BpHYR1_025089 [Brachionus plicatilis]